MRKTSERENRLAVLLLFMIACALPAAQISAAVAAEKSDKLAEKPAVSTEKSDRWYDGIFPLGDKIPVKSLKDEYVPFRTEKEGHGKKTLPARPRLAVEAGDGFLDTGNLSAGFEVPILGAVWQPRLWAYMISRTAFQTFDAGFTGAERETEIANRTDIYINLQLTGTEKILLGLRPLDNNRPDRFTRYTFSGEEEGFNRFTRLGVETLFFEGDFGSLFPNLDQTGVSPIDWGFTVGRQPINFQEGIIINDTIDAVGVIRNNIPFEGLSNFRVSLLYGWNRVDRGDAAARAAGRAGDLEDFDGENDAQLFGAFAAADAKISTFNLDSIYVTDDDGPDSVNIGFAAIQRLPIWGSDVATAFRINQSIAVDEEVIGVAGNGTLITAEISQNVPGSNDIVYFNSFLNFGNYTQAGREDVVGGPLGNTGILFASPSLSTYGAEIDPFLRDDTVGGAVGYQAFWDNGRRNLILEMAGRADISGSPEAFDSLGFGAQLQQAISQYYLVTLESFYTINENRDDGWGARAEFQVVY
jgi:hypothetical protein